MCNLNELDAYGAADREIMKYTMENIIDGLAFCNKVENDPICIDCPIWQTKEYAVTMLNALRAADEE